MIAAISQEQLASKSGKRGNSSSQIDKLISQKSPQTQSGVVTYDLKDLGQKGSVRSNQQSLGQIFSIIEKAKQDLNEDSKN